MDPTQEAYENLINAIVLQAFKDYAWAQRRLRRHPDCLIAQRMLSDVARFMRSDWLEFLTGLDGQWMLERMKSWDI